MTPKSIAGAGLFIASLLEGIPYPTASRSGEGGIITLQFASVVICFTMVFVWLRYDELQFGYRRSTLFNAGIIALPPVFIPLYILTFACAGLAADPCSGEYRSYGLLLRINIGGILSSSRRDLTCVGADGRVPPLQVAQGGWAGIKCRS